MDQGLEKIIVETATNVSWIKEKVNGLCKEDQEIKNRIDKLESWKDKVNTVLILTGGSIGGAWAKLMKLF